MRLLRSLRGRLVIAAAVAVLLAVAGIGGAAAEYVTHELSSTLDRSLRERAGDVARLSASAPSLLTSPGILDSASGGRQLDVEVLDRHGRVVSRSLSLGARLLPITPTVIRALKTGRPGYESLSIVHQALRMYAGPLAETGGPVAGGVVIVASQVGDIDTIGRHVRAGLLAFGVVAALLGALLAGVLVTRALRPLRRLSRGAQAIEQSGKPTQRLEMPASEDEVHDLAAALNRMLAALEATHERERRVLADASHELRTPLTSLSGNIDYLTTHGANEELLSDLRHDAARLKRLVEDLLALEREAATSPASDPVDLLAVVTAAAAGDQHVTISSSGAITVPGDAGALQRAIANLIENALIHGPAGGHVEVSVTVYGEHAEVSITDEGPGIPDGAQDEAFERFWRGSGSGGQPGSGLGLAIVRATAERHRGTVRVNGPTVTMTLPLGHASLSGAANPITGSDARSTAK